MYLLKARLISTTNIYMAFSFLSLRKQFKGLHYISGIFPFFPSLQKIFLSSSFSFSPATKCAHYSPICQLQKGGDSFYFSRYESQQLLSSPESSILLYLIKPNTSVIRVSRRKQDWKKESLHFFFFSVIYNYTIYFPNGLYFSIIFFFFFYFQNISDGKFIMQKTKTKQ